MLEATRQNYALYGIDLRFEQDEQLTAEELESLCRTTPTVNPGSSPIYKCISPESLNVWETDLIEDEYHQDTDAMHLLYANRYAPDDRPEYAPHDLFIPSSVGGLEGHTGSPTQVAAIERTGLNPHGAVLFAGALSSPSQNHKVLMEEIGHGLSVGWADDQAVRVGECYSGGTCYGPGPGTDQTPEAVAGNPEGQWPVMGEAKYIGHRTSRTAFSIEELSTIDLEDIPSVDD